MKKLPVIICILSLFSSVVATAKGGHCGANPAIMAAAAHHKDPWKTLLDKPHTGTAVYENETIACAVQYQSQKLLLTDSANNRLKINPRDLKLQSLTIYHNDTALSLVRLAPKEHTLYRTVHSGKLSIYDDALTFTHNRSNLHVSNIRVAYDGQVKSLNPFFDGKKRLVSYINKVYGTQLDYKNYSWDSLIAYIDHMD